MVQKYSHGWRLMGVLFFLIHTSVIYAQLTGVVKDSTGKPIQQASISLVQKTNGIILSFAITDSNGYYKIVFPAQQVTIDSCLLQVVALGFQKQTILLGSTGQLHYDFSLLPVPNTLPGVTVNSNKVLLKLTGDTLTFDVASFAQAGDRMIGDIIRKIPGIEIDANGQIFYQNKPINRFLIDGTNILDGRYNIATQAIPGELIDKIQILENHQPVRALQDVLPSDKPALNLVLKDKARLQLMGNGDASVGIPSLYNGSFRLLQFTKKVKLIDYYKLNNTGVDLQRELMSFTTDDRSTARPVELLQLNTANPPLDKKRYLLNNSGLLNFNNHFTLPGEVELKVNAYYMHDRIFQYNQRSLIYFLPTDTIRYYDSTMGKTQEQFFRTQLTLNINKKKIYLNNNLVLDHSIQQSYNLVNGTSGNHIQQQLVGNSTHLYNEFHYARAFERTNATLDAYSFFSTIQNPSHLVISPGLQPAVFNNGNAYTALWQEAKVPFLFLNQYLQYRTTGRFRQSYKTGVSYEQQDLLSLLNVVSLNGEKLFIADSFANRLPWRQLAITAEAGFTWQGKKASIQLNLPVVYRMVRYTHGLSRQLAKDIPVMPMLQFRYFPHAASTFDLRYQYRRTWGTIKDVFTSYIMQSYREYAANGNFLPEQLQHTASINYQYRNTRKIFFLTVEALYGRNVTNYLVQQFLNSVLQRNNKIAFPNSTMKRSVSVSLSKYLFFLSATVGGGITFQEGTSNQLQNGVLVDYLNRQMKVKANLNFKFSKWLNGTYAGSFSMFSNGPVKQKSTGNTSQKVRTVSHQLNLVWVPGNRWLCEINNDYYASSIPGAAVNRILFPDIAVTWQWKKMKTDIEFGISNLGNIQRYTTLMNTDNSIARYDYQIRPRMFLVKWYFSF